MAFPVLTGCARRGCKTLGGIDGVGYHVRGSRHKARPNIIISHEISANITPIIESRRVSITQRIIHAIRVAIIALRIGKVLDDAIRLNKPA